MCLVFVGFVVEFFWCGACIVIICFALSLRWFHSNVVLEWQLPLGFLIGFWVAACDL